MDHQQVGRMKPHDIKVTGFVEIGAKDGYEALDLFAKMIQEKFPVTDLRWKTVSIANTQDKDNAELKETIEQMQAEMDQLRLLVYFQGNAVLNQLIDRINGEFKPEDRNRHHLQNATLRKMKTHIKELNAELDANATKSFDEFINNQKADELEYTVQHLTLCSENARENGYHAAADAINDMCDEIREQIDRLRPQ